MKDECRIASESDALDRIGEIAAREGAGFPWDLAEVPAEFRTERVCLAAVRLFGLNLESVPEKFRTEELCLEAVRQDGLALYDVPERLKTPELCLEAVRSRGTALADVPERLRTKEICLEAVQNDGRALEFVPEELKDAAMCTAALLANYGSEAVQQLPEGADARRLCLDALRHGAPADRIPCGILSGGTEEREEEDSGPRP